LGKVYKLPLSIRRSRLTAYKSGNSTTTAKIGVGVKKTVILAGGKGERLHPLTKDVPKSLIKIGGKPIIEHQIQLLEEQGIKEIWLLLGYMGEKIKNYLKDGRKWNVEIHYEQEKKPLGTAGALLQLTDKIKEDFLVLSGDVMLNLNFRKFMNYHLGKENNLASFAVHSTDHPQDSDLVEIDEDGRILNLFKRPHSEGKKLGNTSIASVFVFSPGVFNYIDREKKVDIEKDMLPLILKSKDKTYGYLTQEYIKDMGTLERLEKVRQDYFLGKIQKI
ncbi:MAG: nucleotidyltransferase family protein, partial [Candidatus Azambacteria bacterium]|nr:nucleotidyltransferase family protein [Candidatus Azambacteria bacterium]